MARGAPVRGGRGSQVRARGAQVRARLRLPSLPALLQIPPILPIERFSPALIDVPGVNPVARDAAVALLSRHGRPTGNCAACGRRVCPICGHVLGTREMKLYGLRWVEGSEHFVEAHGMWTPGLALLLRRARFYAPIPGLEARRPVRPQGGRGQGGRGQVQVDLRLPNGQVRAQVNVPARRGPAGQVRAQATVPARPARPQVNVNAQVNLGGVFAPPPPGPYLHIPAIKAWVAWFFGVKREQATDPALKQKLETAAKIIVAQDYRATWDVWEAGIVEAIRLQSWPLSGSMVVSLNAMAEQSALPGWAKTPELDRLPSVRWFRTRIALFLIASDNQMWNPDTQQTPALGAEAMREAAWIVNADAWGSDQPSREITLQLIDTMMGRLSRGFQRTILWLENMAAMLRDSRPRTWAEIAKQQWGITVDAGKAAASGAAAGAGQVLKGAAEGLEKVQAGLSTSVAVGLGLAALAAVGVAVAVSRA